MMNRDLLIKKIKTYGQQITDKVAEIPDYPEPGVSFKDITPVLEDAATFGCVNDCLTELARSLGNIDLVIAPESRGFLFGAVVADRLKTGFVPARKPGKLPRQVIEESYGMEYGKNLIQIHKDAIHPGQRVVIVDDVLATGGTAKAIASLIEHAGGIVAGYVFFITLTYLDGVQLLGKENILSVIDY